MSLTVIINIRRLIQPYMESILARPTGDDGLHLVGYDRHGYWREFYTIEHATAFANLERSRDMERKRLAGDTAGTGG